MKKRVACRCQLSVLRALALSSSILAKDRLQQAIAFADKSRSVMALLVNDIDSFKTFNDSLGYGIGNGCSSA